MQILEWVIGICAGGGSAAGVFGFLMKVDVFPRMIGRSHTQRKVVWYEWMIVSGVMIGAVLTEFPDIPLHVGYWFLIVWGFLIGIFVGCVSIALAEVLNVFPVMFRKLQIDKYLNLYVILMALGKLAGSYVYFWRGIRP